MALSSEEPALDSSETDSQEEAAGPKPVVEKSSSDDLDEDSSESFFAKFMNAQIEPRIDAAFAPTSCENSGEIAYPSSYYQGPLNDSHFHIPALDTEFGFGGDNDEGDEARGVDAELYDSIA